MKIQARDPPEESTTNQSRTLSHTLYTANGISLSLYLHVIVLFLFIPLNNNNNNRSGCISFPLTADGALITSSRMEYVKVNAAPPFSPIYITHYTHIEKESLYIKNFSFFFLVIIIIINPPLETDYNRIAHHSRHIMLEISPFSSSIYKFSHFPFFSKLTNGLCLSLFVK